MSYQQHTANIPIAKNITFHCAPIFNFRRLIYCMQAIITRGLYTSYPLFEVHLCTVTFGLMYG